ncbi:alpha/beta fold hydrolase [Neobacillus vireti]|uniref:alpha/beta fold hydrolase n=1 Tax=Neobacillus vireti TaxID=220686 RepID=UPI002FFFEEA8
MFKSEIVQIGEVKAHVFTAGQGEPLVWLNGAGAVNPDISFFSKLAENNKVYLVENPGFGQSEKIKWVKEAADYNYFYRDFLDYYNLDKVNLVGHSIGGRIALEFAISHPHRVENLVLISPQGAYVNGVKVPDYFHGDKEYQAKLIFHDEGLLKQAINIQNTREEVARKDKNEAALARLIWERNYNPKFPVLLKYVTAPTCIIWGKEDRLYPVEHGTFFNQNIKNSTLQIIEDTGHVPHIEKSEETNRIVQEFLTKKYSVNTF